MGITGINCEGSIIGTKDMEFDVNGVESGIDINENIVDQFECTMFVGFDTTDTELRIDKTGEYSSTDLKNYLRKTKEDLMSRDQEVEAWVEKYNDGIALFIITGDYQYTHRFYCKDQLCIMQ